MAKRRIESQPPNPQLPFNPSEILEGLDQLRTGMQGVITAVSQHREDLRAAGYSETAVEPMCVAFHAYMLQSLVLAAQQASG